jgi:SOS-response transcriptional repressor LexA
MYYENPSGVSVHRGFPNPATDAAIQGLDLNKVLIENGASTYAMRLDSNEWRAVGMFAGDLLLIDRALNPKTTDLVIWWLGGSFAISPKHKLPEGAEVWGVVTTAIHQYRSKE